jgi:hypothetical protein
LLSDVFCVCMCGAWGGWGVRGRKVDCDVDLIRLGCVCVFFFLGGGGSMVACTKSTHAWPA